MILPFKNIKNSNKIIGSTGRQPPRLCWSSGLGDLCFRTTIYAMFTSPMKAMPVANTVFLNTIDYLWNFDIINKLLTLYYTVNYCKQSFQPKYMYCNPHKIFLMKYVQSMFNFINKHLMYAYIETMTEHNSI